MKNPFQEQNSPLNKVNPYANVAFTIQEVINTYQQYQQIKEQETTKRRNIEAYEKTTITEIKAKRDLLIDYLQKSFDERKSNFKHLFDVVDRAIESNNNEQLALALNSIIDLAKSSPFKDLSDLYSFKQALNDEKYTWEI